MKNSLPRAQKLYEKYKGDERVSVVAVATAFEKDQYPWMADEEKILSALRQNKWEFPVMRDKDEASVRIVGLKGTYGTPMTLVIDPGGIVRWHDFNGTAETADAVDATVDRLLESFYVAPIADLDGKLKAYAAGQFGKAYAAAKGLADADGTPEPLVAQAREVMKSIDEGVQRLVTGAQGKRAAGFPEKAKGLLETAAKVFAGVPSAESAAALWKSWKSDSSFAKELKAEAALDKALAKPHPKPEAQRKSLEKLAATYAGTPVAARIQQLLG